MRSARDSPKGAGRDGGDRPRCHHRAGVGARQHALETGAASAGEESQAKGGKEKEREGGSVGDIRSGTSLPPSLPSPGAALRSVPAVRRSGRGAGAEPAAAGSALSPSPGGGAGAPRGRGAVEIYRVGLERGCERGARQEAEGGRGAAEHHLAGNARDQMTVRKGGSRCRERSEPRRSSSSSPASPGGDGGGGAELSRAGPSRAQRSRMALA